VDFRKGEEAVAVPAVIDKRRLKRRLHTRYFCEVDISFELATFRRFKVKFFNLVSLDHRNPRFLRVAGVDQHPHCHYRISVRDLSDPKGPLARQNSGGANAPSRMVLV
jgi:hypothetical protein